ncbi:GDSL-type esterase/lipase family protein [Mucilaginibacter endophyticus]|uniref:GDSL-type esterase/lipase family protein n=1 Tax=Mucilaginibacter endophyticus TaxID=2675003 RepID=UPI0012B16732|nr:GDSL-type esterase/lipase family protein [Mucilaginibacter endophyticus]
MANDKKISELPVAETINASDKSILISNNADYQFDFAALLQFINSGLNAGANLTFGPVLPQNVSGKNGDVFINTTAGSFAQKIAGIWTVVYTIASGGTADTTVLYGTTNPSTATGSNGDTFINTVSGIFYKKSGGTWSQVFSMQTGPQGPQGTSGTNGTNGSNGKTVLNGTANPSNNLGADGDFYINTSSYFLFGPKSAGAWGPGISLIISGVQFEETDNKNTPNGYAGLDGSGKIAAAQLPSYVDDVLEAANYASLPANGEAGKIYITTDTNNEYRWSGSAYIQIVASPGTTDAVPEGTTNKYFTVSRVLTSVLTGIGFSATTAITATDTILQALGKLQAQITGLFKIPTGGASGQILAKNSNADGDLHWINPPSGSGGSGSSEPSGQIKSFRGDYGAVGDGVTDDTVAVNAALLANKRVFDNGDFLVTNMVNDYGCQIEGDVRILKQTPNQKQQINSYADKYQRIFGEEYLSSFHKKLISGTATKVILTGDSTTAGDGTSNASFRIENILHMLTLRYQIQGGVTYTNNAVGGKGTTDWLSTYLTNDLALNPDVYIIRWGVNDTISLTADQFIENLDTGLSTIRANANFTRDKLTIILQSQNTTTDDTSGHKGQIFNEAVNSGLRVLARKYQCCFMDIYGMWQDSKNGQDYINSTDATTLNLIHPKDVFYAWISDAIFKVLYPEYFRKLPFTENTQTGITNMAAFSHFNIGVNYDFVLSDDGYPIKGLLTTHKNSIGMISQYLMPYDQATRIYIRNGYNGIYQEWVQLQAVTPPLIYDGTPGGITIAKLPTAFPIGICTDFVTASDGWPINGMLITHKTSIGLIKQTLSSYDTTTDERVRVGYGSWQAWKQVTLA